MYLVLIFFNECLIFIDLNWEFCQHMLILLVLKHISLNIHIMLKSWMSQFYIGCSMMKFEAGFGAVCYNGMIGEAFFFIKA